MSQSTQNMDVDIPAADPTGSGGSTPTAQSHHSSAGTATVPPTPTAPSSGKWFNGGYRGVPVPVPSHGPSPAASGTPAPVAYTHAAPQPTYLLWPHPYPPQPQYGPQVAGPPQYGPRVAGPPHYGPQVAAPPHYGPQVAQPTHYSYPPYSHAPPPPPQMQSYATVQHITPSSLSDVGTEEMSDSSCGSNSSAASSVSTVRGKRKRLDAKEDTAGPSGSSANQDTKGKAPVRPPVGTHSIPSREYDLLNAQISQINAQLTQLTQTVLKQPREDPLIATEDLGIQLLQGMKETIDILRISHQHNPTAPEGSTDVNDGSTGDVNMGESSTTTAFQVVGQIKGAPTTRSDVSKALARKVRDFFKEVYRGHAEDRAGWEAANGPCCTIENFRLDMTKPPGDAWNVSAKKVFLASFLNRDDPGLELLKPTKADISRLFISNFRRTRSNARWVALHPDEREVEKRHRRRRERKRWLFYRRVTSASRFEETKRHLALLSAYGPDGMSTDASDHDNFTGRPIFRILNPIWRHTDAAKCLRTLDALHRDSRFRPVRRNTQGAHPHDRILSSIPSTSAPVRELPSALYNPAWLEIQTDAVKEYLEVKDSGPYDFSHAAGIESLAQCNNGKLDTIHGYA